MLCCAVTSMEYVLWFVFFYKMNEMFCLLSFCFFFKFCVSCFIVYYSGYMLLFFFKEKLAYERRISGWSADVCSSDLVAVVLVVEEVGVDRSVEARGVQLQAEIVAPLVGALGPGGADLGAAHEDPVGGGVLVGLAGLGNDADVPGLDREGDDVAGELVGAGLLEGADGGHDKSPLLSVSSPRPSRPRWRSRGRRRSTAHRLRPQRERRTATGDFVASRGMTAQPAGEESRSARLRHRRSRRSRHSARSGH